MRVAIAWKVRVVSLPPVWWVRVEFDEGEGR